MYTVMCDMMMQVPACNHMMAFFKYLQPVSTSDPSRKDSSVMQNMHTLANLLFTNHKNVT